MGIVGLFVSRLTPCSYVDSPMIRVLVGNEEVPKEFHVHEALICSRSDFFKNALKKPWLEAEEWKVTLAKEEPEIFSLYLKFLYVSLYARPGKILLRHISPSPTSCLYMRLRPNLRAQRSIRHCASSTSSRICFLMIRSKASLLIA